MARKKAESASSSDPRPVVVEGGSVRVEARVLVDFWHKGDKVAAGTLFVDDEAIVEQYTRDGLVDPHAAAVAAVKAQQG
jgi:hypothetical protein